MRKYYIAAFVPEKEGNFSVYFPDAPGAVTGGYSLEECEEYGADILEDLLQELAAAKKPIPEPSNKESVQRKVSEIRRESGLAMPDGVHYQLFRAPSLDMAPVKITVSLPRATLEEADKKAEAYGFTRSGLSAQAVRAYGQ
ncbi:MAG: type II toxin-antitoxin system HicB family antitoxin [Desulfovibrio sp.]|jgi:predicted RNase H-like HicB family nuclease|nr:type II toxin-antitoxin system HicB family antitoxin [Desulfovibrio sp.]